MRVPISCLKCNTGSFDVLIYSFMKHGRINCECSITERKKRDQIHWKTDSGLEEVQKKCEERKYKLVMDLDQWGSNIKSVTRFSVECLVCDVVGETSCENLVTKNQEMKCLCNDLLPWSSEYRFFAMKNLCQTRNCVLKYKLEEWIEKVKTYQKYVPIYCNKCKTKVTTTSVGAFYSDIFGTSSLSQSIPDPTLTLTLLYLYILHSTIE